MNSIGALGYLIGARFNGRIKAPQGVFDMAIALPPGSPLEKSLDETWVAITGSQEWRQIEEGYFGRQQ